MQASPLFLELRVSIATTMSLLQQQDMHPPDPGITGSLHPWSTPAHDSRIYTHLADIAKHFESETAKPTTHSDCSLELSNECIRTWVAIQSLGLTELRVNYRQVECFRELIRDIQRATVSNSLTDAETAGFICQLSNFSHVFERTMNNGDTSPPCRSESMSGPSFFRNANRVDIQNSILVMDNRQTDRDTGVSNHLKHIKYILIIQISFLFP